MDFTEIKEIISLKDAIRNPYYESLVKNGFSIKINYSPDDVEEIIAKRHDKNTFMTKNPNEKEDFNLLSLDDEELAALEEYHKSKVH